MKLHLRWLVITITLIILLTPLAPAADDWWQFAVISDTQSPDRVISGKRVLYDATGVNTEVLRNIAAAIANEPRCRLVVATGDLIVGDVKQLGGKIEQANLEPMYRGWRLAMQPVYDAGIPVYPMRGNHETYGDPNGSQWQKAFGEYLPQNGPPGEVGMTYSFVYKNAFFACLDEFQGHLCKVNQTWLDSRLKENIKPHVFIFGHIPAFKIAEMSYNCLLDRDAFWKSIHDAGCRIYFCGHLHFASCDLVKGFDFPSAFQFINGCGGGKLIAYARTADEHAKEKFHDDKHHGYALVTIDGNIVIVEWKGLSHNTWKIYDRFKYVLKPKK